MKVYWTRARLIAALRRDARRRGRPPRSSDWRTGAGRRYPNAALVRAEFGSFDAGLVAAGFPAQGNGFWTRARLVAALQRDAARRGRPPSFADWQTNGRGYGSGSRRRPTAATVQRLFGSWNAGLEAAGLPIQKSGGGPA